jgi:hypothetical protein
MDARGGKGVLRRRGTFLLLDHFARLERLGASERARPKERLESRLGPDLARRLVRSLAGDHALRPRDLAA